MIKNNQLILISSIIAKSAAFWANFAMFLIVLLLLSSIFGKIQVKLDLQAAAFETAFKREFGPEDSIGVGVIIFIMLVFFITTKAIMLKYFWRNKS